MRHPMAHPVPLPSWAEDMLERLRALEARVESIESDVREALRKLDDIGSDSSPSGGFRVSE